MQNLLNPPWQYSKCHTRVEEAEKCLYESLDPTYNFSIFSCNHQIIGRGLHQTFFHRLWLKGSLVHEKSIS